MVRFILVIVLFLLSWLTVFRAPTNLLWYVSIIVTEFSWIFFLLVAILTWRIKKHRLKRATAFFGAAALILYSIPVINAYRVSSKLLSTVKSNKLFSNHGQESPPPFRVWKMITGISKKQVEYKTMMYDSSLSLSLDFYHSIPTGKKPCVVVVHGGSWSGGDSKQLPELNTELANSGYHVAAINYRLAPKNLFPAPIQDVESALSFLKLHADELAIDTVNFVLLGRSAGGQIVLSAADMLHDNSIKGVINIYGPADMVWGYANPTNPLVLNSKKIMEDYLGGTNAQVPQQYINSSATETAYNQTVPTLSIYGKNDPLVSYKHGKRLSAKLDIVRTNHFELYLPWATHGFDWTLNGPGGQLSTWTIKQFLKSTTGNQIQ